MLAFACFFAGWKAGHRQLQIENDDLRLQVTSLQENRLQSQYNSAQTIASFVSENMRLKQQIATLEETVEKLKARSEKIDAVQEHPGATSDQE